MAHATFGKRFDEAQFYRAYLQQVVKERLRLSEELVSEAISIASATDVGGVDAMHLAAAVMLEADEFITLERPSSPLFREKRVSVRNLNDINL